MGFWVALWLLESWVLYGVGRPVDTQIVGWDWGWFV